MKNKWIPFSKIKTPMLLPHPERDGRAVKITRLGICSGTPGLVVVADAYAASRRGKGWTAKTLSTFSLTHVWSGFAVRVGIHTQEAALTLAKTAEVMRFDWTCPAAILIALAAKWTKGKLESRA